ncbi:MAG: hypothetical protein P8Y53_12925 [Pseudolabrys sp.]
MLRGIADHRFISDCGIGRPGNQPNIHESGFWIGSPALRASNPFTQRISVQATHHSSISAPTPICSVAAATMR